MVHENNESRQYLAQLETQIVNRLINPQGVDKTNPKDESSSHAEKPPNYPLTSLYRGVGSTTK